MTVYKDIKVQIWDAIDDSLESTIRGLLKNSGERYLITVETRDNGFVTPAKGTK